MKKDNLALGLHPEILQIIVALISQENLKMLGDFKGLQFIRSFSLFCKTTFCATFIKGLKFAFKGLLFCGGGNNSPASQSKQVCVCCI